MAMHVCTGAMMKCSMGLAPSNFIATPKMVMTGNMPAGNIMDFVPVHTCMAIVGLLAGLRQGESTPPAR